MHRAKLHVCLSQSEYFPVSEQHNKSCEEITTELFNSTCPTFKTSSVSFWAPNVRRSFRDKFTLFLVCLDKKKKKKKVPQ